MEALCLALALCWGAAAGMPPEGIMEQEAARVARAFLGDPTIALPKPRMVGPGDDLSFSYELPDGRTVAVNRSTGRVEWYYDRSAELDQRPAVLVSEADTEREIRRFAQEHYPDVLERHLVVRANSSGKNVWVIYIERIPENGALNRMGSLLIEANRTTGRVASVLYKYRPLPPEARRKPNVSREAAIDTAIGATQFLRVYGRPEVELAWTRPIFADGPALVWAVSFKGYLGRNRANSVTVWVDALKGGVVGEPAYGVAYFVAEENQCVLHQDWGMLPAIPIVVLTLRPRVDEGKLWMPVRFAELFDLKVALEGDTVSLSGKDGECVILARLPVRRWEEEEYLPAEEMLKAVEKQVWEVKADVAHASLLVGVHSAKPLERALALKLGRRP
ncbi:MAG: hypothetical protein GX785_07765 [Armatimonadetes bacterium]|nr:hypothetical protein [Armatimonadota bacterium]